MSEQLINEAPKASGRISFREIANTFQLSSKQIAEARIAGVTNDAEFVSFLQKSTHLAEAGFFDSAAITAQLAMNESVQKTVQAENSDTSHYSIGAFAPEGVAYAEKGDTVPELSDSDIQILASFDAGPLASEEAIYAKTCGDWPVRDQGQRGTCVAFATCAAYELFFCKENSARPDLSEQFLYWAIKHNNLDGLPTTDGTWHRHAVTALNSYGVSHENDWPYNPLKAESLSQNPPPPNAINSAQQNISNIPIAQSYTGANRAAALLELLKNHNGVAIALPVFDAPSGNGHNWNSGVAESYGFVQAPAPSWTANGGHAVLCVGFKPDPEEATGGHFIIRNSWGTTWGANLPHPDFVGGQPGYGQVPATYVDRYLWETCVF